LEPLEPGGFSVAYITDSVAYFIDYAADLAGEEPGGLM